MRSARQNVQKSERSRKVYHRGQLERHKIFWNFAKPGRFRLNEEGETAKNLHLSSMCFGLFRGGVINESVFEIQFFERGCKNQRYSARKIELYKNEFIIF